MPEKISLSSRPQQPQPLTQVHKVTHEDFARAEADMMLLMKKHDERHQAMIVNELPDGFRAPEPLEIRRAKETLTRGKAKVNRDSELAEERRQAKISPSGNEGSGKMCKRS